MFVQQVSMVTPPGGSQLIAPSVLATHRVLQSTHVGLLVQKFSARTAQTDIRDHCVISKFIKRGRYKECVSNSDLISEVVSQKHIMKDQTERYFGTL